MADFMAYLAQQREAHLKELSEFLTFPSISALGEHKADMVRTAEWLVAAMTRAGLENARILPTAGHPSVYAEWLHAPGAPTALVYGHYDVQPVDPLHLWESPPFSPTVRDGKIYARGAVDDKGQVFAQLKAVEALLRTEGKLPVNLKFLVEGEEEIGSRHLPALLREQKELLQADVVVISDTAFFAADVPAVTTGLRGLVALELTLRGPKGDLHSGVYGGAVQNPLHAMVQLLAGLRGPDGRILVEGFYDKVRPISPEERQAWASLPFSEEALRQEVGAPGLFGEAGFSAIERTWARPTLEVNGLWGGFTGEGTKTVLPAEAHAKITCRLVPDQEPDEIYELIARQLHENLPPGVTLEVRKEKGMGRPVLTPVDHPAVRAAFDALRETYGKEPVPIRSGGSIPIVESFATILGLPSVLLGFGLPGENEHAPNEHWDLRMFDGATRTLARYWHRLAAALR